MQESTELFPICKPENFPGLWRSEVRREKTDWRVDDRNGFGHFAGFSVPSRVAWKNWIISPYFPRRLREERERERGRAVGC